MSGEVNFDKDGVKRQIDAATEKAAAALAFWIEAQTKGNIQANGQIDTGFMLNSTFSVTKAGSGHGGAQGQAKAKNPAGGMGPDPKLNDALAAVAVGAEYAIWQELKQSFLFKAGEQAKAVAKVVMEPVFQREIGS